VTAPGVSRLLPKYPENFFFSYLDVAFIGINEPSNHNAIDGDYSGEDYAGDINAYWIDTKLSELPSSPSAIVLVGHSTFSNKVRSILLKQGSTPILNVKGDSHLFCTMFGSSFPNSNLLSLTVKPYEAGPLLVSILVDNEGNHFFHVEETPGC